MSTQHYSISKDIKVSSESQHLLNFVPLSLKLHNQYCHIEGAFITERIAKGNVDVHWYAKKIDHYTPMFNDTVLYRHQHAYHKKMANVYFNRLLFEGKYYF